MTDIIVRLHDSLERDVWALRIEAADEIERLRLVQAENERMQAEIDRLANEAGDQSAGKRQED